MKRSQASWICSLLLAQFLILTPLLILAETPRSLGYQFPDEWEAHAGTMMIFPAKHSYGRKTKALRREFAHIAQAIAKNEPVHVFCMNRERPDCEALLGSTKNVAIHAGNFPIDWARDNAPMVLRNQEGKLATAGFQFNGWGKKYQGWQDDVATRNRIAKRMGWHIFPSEFVLEGGAIEIGGGVGIVTESCVLNPNRTDWSRAQVTHELQEMLGLQKIIWLESGLMPDKITDGHVDGLLKFIAEDTVLLHTTDLRSDVNYQICQDAKDRLLAEGLRVIELPLMEDIVHINFYIGSGGKIAYVPICGKPDQDDPVLAILEKHFDEVVPILAAHLAAAGGGIHCYTQQIPLSR